MVYKKVGWFNKTPVLDEEACGRSSWLKNPVLAEEGCGRVWLRPTLAWSYWIVGLFSPPTVSYPIIHNLPVLEGTTQRLW